MPRNWTTSDLSNKTNLPRPGLPKQTESQMQTECVDWFREAYPQFAKLFWANPNGGYRSPKTAAILKREGVLSGVPDCTLAVPRKPYHGLYLELKRKGNKPTPNQVEVMQLLTEQGYRCDVVYNIEEFKGIIQNYLNEI